MWYTIILSQAISQKSKINNSAVREGVWALNPNLNWSKKNQYMSVCNDYCLRKISKK